MTSIEKDPRYLQLVKDYKYKLQKAKSVNGGVFAMGLSIITSPLYVIALSLQVSVVPHLTIYGDVDPEKVKKAQ